MQFVLINSVATAGSGWAEDVIVQSHASHMQWQSHPIWQRQTQEQSVSCTLRYTHPYTCHARDCVQDCVQDPCRLHCCCGNVEKMISWTAVPKYVHEQPYPSSCTRPLRQHCHQSKSNAAHQANRLCTKIASHPAGSCTPQPGTSNACLGPALPHRQCAQYSISQQDPAKRTLPTTTPHHPSR